MKTTIDLIERELRDPPASGAENYLTKARIFKHDIATAIRIHGATSPETRSATAIFGGRIKIWHQFLVEILTARAFMGIDQSRHFVRAWQRATFGRSVASARLARYAEVARSGGGRRESVEGPCVEIVAAVVQAYAKYRDALRDAV